MFNLRLQGYGGLLASCLLYGSMCSPGLAITGLAITELAKTEGGLEQTSKQFGAMTEPKDPTQPPGAARRRVASVGNAAKVKLKVPILTSILTSDQRRLAVINGKLVREGDQVAGMTLVRVSKDEVQLQARKQTQAQPQTQPQILVLRLPKSNIGKDYR